MKGISIKKQLIAFIAKATESDESKLKYSKTGFLISSALSVVSGMVMLQGGVLGDNDILIVVFGVLCLIFAAIGGFFAMTVNGIISSVSRQKADDIVRDRKDPPLWDSAK